MGRMTSSTDPAPLLPAGLTTRPLQRDDAGLVFALMAAQEQEDLGSVEIEEADLVSDWARPSHDLAARSVAVLDGDLLVGYAELTGVDRADAAVLPSHRGRGIGTWLAWWLRDLGRRLGSPVVGMPVPEGSPGDRLLAALGWEVRWTSWVLQLPPGTEVPARDLPAGYAVRTAADADLRATHDVLEDAFLEWSVRDREPFEDFRASLVERPGFEPWNLRVVTDDGGAVVGVALVHLSAGGSSPTSRASPYDVTSAAAGWPRSCSWTASAWRASTERASASSAPTPAPVRWGSTSGSACARRPPGSTAPFVWGEPSRTPRGPYFGVSGVTMAT